jgi:hypothetical protein
MNHLKFVEIRLIRKNSWIHLKLVDSFKIRENSPNKCKLVDKKNPVFRQTDQ